MKDYRIYLSFGDDIRITFYIKAQGKKKVQKIMKRILPTYPDGVVRIVETSTLTIKEKKGK